MTPSILITDGEQRAALAATRSLGTAGYRVFVCSGRSPSLAGTSRFADRHATVPDPITDPRAFANQVQELCTCWSIDVLLPITEGSVLAVLERREQFPNVSIPFSSVERFCTVSDKVAVTHAARRVGISVPEQRVIASASDEGWSETVDTIPYPVVIKPSRSVGDSGQVRKKLGVQYARNAVELKATIAHLPPQAFPLLVQQRVVGPGIGIFLLREAGESLAVFAHRRIREKPPSGGVSVYRESIEAPTELVGLSEALLDDLEWEGVAMVEFKVDERTGAAYLMEINGRLWGSLQLAIDAGVDFPRLLVERACGSKPAPVRRYRVGVRSRWWWGDVDHLLLRLVRSPQELALPPGAPGRIRAVLEFLRLWRPGDRNEIFRWDDPSPAWTETLEWLRR